MHMRIVREYYDWEEPMAIQDYERCKAEGKDMYMIMLNVNDGSMMLLELMETKKVTG